LPSDHRAQIVVSFVESLDLGELCAAIELREGAQGRLHREKPFPSPARKQG